MMIPSNKTDRYTYLGHIALSSGGTYDDDVIKLIYLARGVFK